MPVIASYLREGRISLTKLGFLKDLLTPEGCVALLDEAALLSEKQVEDLAAARSPERAPPRDTIRPLPPPRRPAARPPALDLFTPPPSAAPPPSPPPPPPARHEITMTVGAELMVRLGEVRAALSHSHPNATLETLFAECMRVTLAARHKRVEAETDRPRPPSHPPGHSRRPTADVRRQVWKRDGRRCTFVSPDGHRCQETRGLELDHILPFALGGASTVENLRVVCKTHNLHLARVAFGDDLLDCLIPTRPH